VNPIEYDLYAKEAGGPYGIISILLAPLTEINLSNGNFDPLRGKHVFFVVKAIVNGPLGPITTLPSNEIEVDIPFIGPTNLRVE
jgi:hypothetical protein